MRLSLQHFFSSHGSPLPAWLRRVAPRSLWLEDDISVKTASTNSDVGHVLPPWTLKPNSVSKEEPNAHKHTRELLDVSPDDSTESAPAAAGGAQDVSYSHFSQGRIPAAGPLSPVHGGKHHNREPYPAQPPGLALSSASQKLVKPPLLKHTTSNCGQCWEIQPTRLPERFVETVSSSESDHLNTVGSLTQAIRIGKNDSRFGSDAAAEGLAGETRLHSAEAAAGETEQIGRNDWEEHRTVWPAGKESATREGLRPAKVTRVGSWRHYLIRHLVRLKRRSDIRRECGSILLLGYPLIRFMSSPWFYRLASRQAGGLLPLHNSNVTPSSVVSHGAEGKNRYRDCDISACQGVNHSGVFGRSLSNVPVEKPNERIACQANQSPRYSSLMEAERGNLKFDLLVTDSAALVKRPSLHLIECSEAVYASPDAVDFLMRREVPEYFQRHGKRGVANFDAHSRQARKVEVKRNYKSYVTGLRSINAVALLERPTERTKLENVKCLLALDRVKYVGNVGILARAAAAFGFDGIFYIDGTADPFNWKVMEVSNGLHYNLPHFRGSATDLLTQCERCSLLPVVADTNGLSPDCLHDLTSSGGICCVLGNESYGAADILLRHCKRVRIPMSNLVDSLNVAVAGGIVMYEMKKMLEHVKFTKEESTP